MIEHTSRHLHAAHEFGAVLLAHAILLLMLSRYLLLARDGSQGHDSNAINVCPELSTCEGGGQQPARLCKLDLT